jgi:hypothetical protein
LKKYQSNIKRVEFDLGESHPRSSKYFNIFIYIGILNETLSIFIAIFGHVACT